MFEAIAANRRKSALLVVLMALLLGALGYALGELYAKNGGPFGLVIAAIVWLVLTLVAYSQGDQIFLNMSGARKIGPDDLPVLWNVVEEMTIASGLPKMPTVYVIDDPTPNAFATGRTPETAAVAVTMGLLKRLDRDELQGVIAHELGHVKNRDILLMLFAGVLMGAIVLLADVGLRSWLWGGGRSRRSSNDSGRRTGHHHGPGHRADDPGAAHGPDGVLRHLPAPRVPGRRLGRGVHPLPRGPGAGPGEDLGGAGVEPARGQPGHGAHVHRQPAGGGGEEAERRLAHRHPSAHRRAGEHPAVHVRGAASPITTRCYGQVTGKKGVVPRSALADAQHAGAGLRVQGASGWQERRLCRRTSLRRRPRPRLPSPTSANVPGPWTTSSTARTAGGGSTAPAGRC